MKKKKNERNARRSLHGEPIRSYDVRPDPINLFAFYIDPDLFQCPNHDSIYGRDARDRNMKKDKMVRRVFLKTCKT